MASGMGLNKTAQVIKELGLWVPFIGGDDMEIKLCIYSEMSRFGKLRLMNTSRC